MPQAGAAGDAMRAAAIAQPGKQDPQRPHSYLDHWVDSALSLVIHDSGTRHEVDQYATGALTTAALFAPGWTGRIATAATYSLAQASPDTSAGQQLADGALGAVKGAGLRWLYNSLAQKMTFAPSKGIVLGAASRGLDTLLNVDAFNHPTEALSRLQAQVINPQAWAFDAAVWTAGETIFHGANHFSGGKLVQNRIASGMFMGGTFGAINGSAGEIARQHDAGGPMDWSAVVRKGLIQGGVDALAAGAGSSVRDPFTARPAARLSSGEQTSPPRSTSIERADFALAGEAPTDATSAQKSSSGRPADSQGESPGASQPIGDGRSSEARADGAAAILPEGNQPGETGVSVSKASPPEDFDLESILEEHRLRRSIASIADREFPVAGSLDVVGSDGRRVPVITDYTPISVVRDRLFADSFALNPGETTINLMAPLVVGDAHNIESDVSRTAWEQFDKHLADAKQLGVDGISTDVWWGLIEPKQGQFDWSYYDKLSDHIARAGLKWVPILSFHQCGGNVGDNVYVPLPDWVWSSVAEKAGVQNVRDVQYVSEQGNASKEFISAWATKHALDHYGSVMEEFQRHFADRANNISEINVSLGPAGELRYPSYNSHDQNVGYPTRGALQAYSELARQSFRDFALSKYGTVDEVAKAWGIPGLTADQINPPSDPTSFYSRADHLNMQYGKDFFDWYSGSLIDHGRLILGAAVNKFGAQDAPFFKIDIGAKIPGVHWTLGRSQDGQIVYGPRLAELDAGLIRTSQYADWTSDAAGHGYKPLMSLFKDLQPLHAGSGTRVVPSFTAIEMSDGQDGPAAQSMPHTLAAWVGQLAHRMGVPLKGENALAGTLYNGYNWDLMMSLMALPNYSGYYHGVTLLRMSDVLNNGTARAKATELINAVRAARAAEAAGTDNGEASGPSEGSNADAPAASEKVKDSIAPNSTQRKPEDDKPAA